MTTYVLVGGPVDGEVVTLKNDAGSKVSIPVRNGYRIDQYGDVAPNFDEALYEKCGMVAEYLDPESKALRAWEEE